MTELDPSAFKILIVDDNPVNIQVVGTLLRGEGYPTAFAQSGARALQMVRSERFDLILLDIMMPGMDGFETLARLREEEKNRDIPTIFLTARGDADGIAQGFEMGAWDYVTKPFIGRELLARVRHCLRAASMRKELERRYEEIRGLEAMRESLTQMIVHDLKGPLTGISGYADLLSMEGKILQDRRVGEYVAAIGNCSQTMMDMIMAILDVAKMESGNLPMRPSKVDLRGVIREVAEGLRPLLERTGLRLGVRLTEPPFVMADPEILRRILVNLIGNAIHFSPSKGEIVVEAAPRDGMMCISVTDQGPGIPDEYREIIFDKYQQLTVRNQNRKYSTGLGLTFCKLAVEAHGGGIGVEPAPERGSRFWLSLPGFRDGGTTAPPSPGPGIATFP